VTHSQNLNSQAEAPRALLNGGGHKDGSYAPKKGEDKDEWQSGTFSLRESCEGTPKEGKALPQHGPKLLRCLRHCKRKIFARFFFLVEILRNWFTEGPGCGPMG